VDGGVADLLLLGERALQCGTNNPTFLCWRSAAALPLAAKGDEERAHELIRDEIARSHRARADRALGMALRAQGLLTGGAEGEQLLRESVRIQESCGAQLERARALVDLGAMLRRGNRRSDAQQPLTEGLEAARRCGATLLVDQAATELEATGARPRRGLEAGRDALTPSERRVAELAAQGQTNAQIAQGLFVTLKTVETHLSSVYRKLDISSRRELPAAFS